MMKPGATGNTESKRKSCIGLEKNICSGDCIWIPQKCTTGYDGVKPNMTNVKNRNSYIQEKYSVVNFDDPL